jgi:hypothetical protein
MQSPVARDLRFLLALDHVSYELERMGDHAASVAKQVRKLAPHPPLKHYIDLPAMGELAATLVGSILLALVDVDVDAARRVAARDDEIDDLYHRTFAEVVVLMRADPENVERGTRILFASHYVERIGDRVTNIAEDVVFLASGEIEDLKAHCLTCNMRELCLPVGLTADEMKQVDALIVNRTKLKKHEALYRAGEPFHALYAIRIGSLKTNMLVEDGRTQVAGYHMPGDIIGLDGVGTEPEPQASLKR